MKKDKSRQCICMVRQVYLFQRQNKYWDPKQRQVVSRGPIIQDSRRSKPKQCKRKGHSKYGGMCRQCFQQRDWYHRHKSFHEYFGDKNRTHEQVSRDDLNYASKKLYDAWNVPQIPLRYKK